MKKVILIFCDYYLPGYKAGGPIKSISSIVDRLGDQFTFKIVTRDCDYLSKEPYKDIVSNKWHRIGSAEVLYLGRRKRGFRPIHKVMNSVPYEAVYLNSFFSPHYSIKILLLRWLKLVPDVPYLLATRGEFSREALKLKPYKKRPFIVLVKALGIYRGVKWHVSSQYEKQNFISVFCNNKKSSGECDVIVASPLISLLNETEKIPSYAVKRPGHIKILFFARVAPMKNLLEAIGLLRELSGDVEYNIYGPIDDVHYWSKCSKVMDLLPENIKIIYRGKVPPHQAKEIFEDHHLMFQPSLGENFGHSIIESLLFGCPVLISDRTPWRDLEVEGVGWDIDLTDKEKFKMVLQNCINMDEAEYRDYRIRARKFARMVAGDDEKVTAYENLFYNLLRN